MYFKVFYMQKSGLFAKGLPSGFAGHCADIGGIAYLSAKQNAPKKSVVAKKRGLWYDSHI